MDDDDEFLYGPSSSSVAAAPVSHPKPVENVLANNGIVSQLEAAAEAEAVEVPPEEVEGAEENATEEEESEEEEEIEFIMEPTARSLDFRQQRPQQTRTPTKPTSQPPSQPGPTLTTEYTPIQRGDSLTLPSSFSHPHPSQSQSHPAPALTKPSDTSSAIEDPADAIDTSTLPPAHAPPSHPDIDPSAPGMLDGRPIFDVDIAAMADKPWRRPGSDISDWFNYGFDEISWEAYCFRRRELGEVAGVLKLNVLNFAGMPEDQLASLPPQVRQMVMTGTSAMMNGAGGNPAGMMGPMNGMNGMQMMDMNMGNMSNMSNMGGMMNPMAMGMNGDMGVGVVGMMPMMEPGVQPGPGPGGQGPGPGPVQGPPGQGQVGGGGPGGGAGTPEQSMMQVQVPVVQDAGGGYVTPGSAGPGPVPVPAGAGAMGMGMGEFGMQEQQMYAGMDGVPSSAPGVGVGGGPVGGNGSGQPPGVSTPVPGSAGGRGVTPTGAGQGSYRGRGGMMGMGGMSNMGMRGRGGYSGRGRGRGALYSGEAPSAPPRPASPLPPGVPTGPRNQNKYKDRDGNAPAVDGLDYGGDRGGGTRTPSGEPEDRGSRKRRSSPGLDDPRKRR